MIADIAVGERAVIYTKDKLAIGGSLAGSVLAQCTFNSDEAYSGLPSGTSDTVAQDFEHGEKFPRGAGGFKYWKERDDRFRAEPVPNADEWLVRKIVEYLAKSRNNLCIFENSSAEPGYPWIEESGLRTLSFNDEVYHYLVHGDAGDDSFVRKSVRLSRSWLFLGFLTSLPPKLDGLTDRSSLTESHIAELAR